MSSSIPRRSLGLGAAGLLLLKPQQVRSAQSNSALRVGLLGCGERGSAVITGLLESSNTQVVALADLFQDKLEAAKTKWEAANAKKGFTGEIDRKLMFRGPKAFEAIANAKGIDAIVLATPCYFHPEHLEAIVAAGRHVYSEKPTGVDVVGCERFLAAGKKAQGRMSLAVGFQVRTAPAFAEVVNRIHKGAIGKIGAVSGYYHATTQTYPEYPGKGPLETRLRRFFWDKVISGDIMVDQNIHILDICNWALGAHPIKATGQCARNIRNDASDIMDHWGVVLTYPGGVTLTFNSIQYGEAYWDVGIRFLGDKGMGEAYYSGVSRIVGPEPYDGGMAKPNEKFSMDGAFVGLGNCDQNKARLFYDSIVNNKFLNEAQMGVDGALTAILAREACYKGGTLTWDELLKSKQSYQGKIDVSRFA